MTLQGYAICDIINGFRLGPAFLAHGTAMFILAAFFNELEASHILTPMLVMELSTIVLAILRADFFTPIMQLVTQASFALLFFVARILIAPYVYYDIAMIMFDHTATCFPKSMFYVTLSFGAFFHSLNAFCKYK